MDCFHVLVFLFFLLITYSTLHPVCGNAELRALLQLKSSLDPENKFLKSWTSQGDPCSGLFEGVACNQQRQVSNISLQGKGLSGKISPAVAELKFLSGLYLHYNNLSGEIPEDIANLTDLTDLYLNVNSLSGGIPPQVGNMPSLQVLELCCNQLTGYIPSQMGYLNRLSVLALQHNKLTEIIPPSLGNLRLLRKLDLSFNALSGTIPTGIAKIPQLEVLDVRSNSLSGVVPPALKRLKGGFQYGNNSGLCGVGFPAMRACSVFDNQNINQLKPLGSVTKNTSPEDIPPSVKVQMHCNQNHCSLLTKCPQVAIAAGVITLTIILATAGSLIFVRYRRRKQKLGSTSCSSDDRLSSDQIKGLRTKGASPFASFGYCNRIPIADAQNGIGFPIEKFPSYCIRLEEIESATQYFSEANLLGRSNVSSVYKGTLWDCSVVAVKCIKLACCRSEEDEFLKGLELLTSLKHENLVRFRGFCCSRGRGDFFLVHDFAPKGTLSQYLDVECGSSCFLDWSTRVSVVNGIAKGIGYLHSSESDKPATVHKNISVEKILLDRQLKPLISDSGLPMLLADDFVFSAIKVSASMGYLAPEYIFTGGFTEKSDMYAFGVTILQILSGKRQLTNSMRLAAESCTLEGFMDRNLKNRFSASDAVKLTKIAVRCTHEFPEQRPNIQEVTCELTS